MKIIMNQDVQNLGEEGDVREVARGYARNYLFRKGFAVPYNKQNIALLEQRKTAIEKRKEEKRAAAAGLKSRIEALKIEITMPAGDTGRLFGSVTAAAVAEEMEKQGIAVEKKKIDIPGTTIKMIGEHAFTVRLYENETAQCSLSIVPEKRASGKTESAKEKKTVPEQTADESEWEDEQGIVEEAVQVEAAEQEAVEEPAADEDVEEDAEEDAVTEDSEEED